MGLLNYTTEIPATKSMAEIQQLLVKAKASAMMTEFDGAGNAVALSFRVMTQYGQMAFTLPANPKPIVEILNRQSSTGIIPRRYKNDVDQARRVAWRIVKDWVEAQLAIVETGMVTIDQVFLPYAQNPDTGETLYQRMVATRFSGLALPERTGDNNARNIETAHH